MTDLLKKRSTERKKSSEYFIPGIFLDVSEFNELFAVVENENLDHGEETDDESIIFDSDSEDTSSEDESDVEIEQPIPDEEVFFFNFLKI